MATEQEQLLFDNGTYRLTATRLEQPGLVAELVSPACLRITRGAEVREVDIPATLPQGCAGVRSSIPVLQAMYALAVQELQAEGAFTNLRGLIYFTDGMGIYPQKRPPYDVAFVLLEEPPISVKIPPWAIRLVLDTPALERTVKELDLTLDSDIEELPQL